jgi:guanylate kinase
MTYLSSGANIGIDPLSSHFLGQSKAEEFKGGIILLSGPSGAGKDTFVRRLISEIPDLEYGVSTTSRALEVRNGHMEMDGVHYYSRPVGVFSKVSDFVEMNHYAGNHYGMTVEEVRRVFSNHHHLATDIDVNGAQSFITHQEFGERVFSIFIKISLETMRERILARKPHILAKDLNGRLAEYENECSQIEWFHAVVSNDVHGETEAPYQAIKKEVEKFLANLPK